MKINRIVLSVSAAVLALTGCGSGSGDSGSGGGERLSVATSFYPLQHAAQQVGGDHVDVTNLTKPGAEPHDLELTPKQTLDATKADALVYLKDFQPSVDDASKEAGDAAFDVSPFARLDLEPAQHEDEGEGEGEGGDHEGHDHGSVDPHFWLDPTRYADVVDAIADRFAEIDPDHAADYRANAKAFTAELDTLDRDLEQGLSTCRSEDLVTGHSAFGYFADRYGFHQESVSGLSPDSEPSPSALADLIKHVKDEKIGTVYAETLVPADVAKTIARDSGAKVAVLDPIEGLTDESAGSDYVEIMRSNLATVRKGQGCS
ncbi:ABC transporter substrate-binding protein [Janibacter sp. Soil728]|uniref:metal ABC transporter substrate-binding protein n=1 Tax=Janibacter sp. Soil728 TaxID=1736393 RepID=UPI0006FBD73F|nr:metal ABC transporter substrate-binding protein [Janibacter sp. Soil728]KRE37955.1 ABC transporter substrate-binding protein [Janibacter sp. Soil728]